MWMPPDKFSLGLIMAMTLSSLAKVAALTQYSNVQVTDKTDKRVADAFKSANDRIGKQLDVTNVKLSAFGQVKFSFSDVQIAGKNLYDPKKTGSADNVLKAAQSFANAYNNATKTAYAASREGNSKAVGTLASDRQARLAGDNLSKVAKNDNNFADLKKIGISIDQNGTMSVDANALQNAMAADPNAVQDTLARVGKQAEQVAKDELASGGNIGSADKALSARAKNLEAQMTEQQNIASASQVAVQKQVSSITSNAVGGVAAYVQQMLSF